MTEINKKHDQDLELEYQDFETVDVDVKKERLNKSAERLKTVIDAQVDELKENAAAWGKMIALVGGGVYLTFKILGKINRSRKEAKKERRIIEKLKRSKYSSPSIPSIKRSYLPNVGFSLVGFLKHQLTLLAIAIAKRRIMNLVGNLIKR